MGCDLTEEVRKTISSNPNMLVPHYLIHSYLYYELDTAVIADSFYDKEICKALLDKWGTIEHHHKHLINRDDLHAGTGYSIKDYPGIVKGAAHMMVHELNQKIRGKKKKGRRKSKRNNGATSWEVSPQ